MNGPKKREAYNLSNTYEQTFIYKFDKNGNTLWEREFGEDSTIIMGSVIKENLDNTFTITGGTISHNPNDENIFLLKTDQDGRKIWFVEFGSQESDWGVNLIKDANNNNIISGSYSDKIFITTIDNDGKYK